MRHCTSNEFVLFCIFSELRISWTLRINHVSITFINLCIKNVRSANVFMFCIYYFVYSWQFVCLATFSSFFFSFSLLLLWHCFLLMHQIDHGLWMCVCVVVVYVTFVGWEIIWNRQQKRWCETRQKSSAKYTLCVDIR